MIQRVNLYKAEFQPRRQWLAARQGVGVIAVALIIVVVAGGWFRYQATERAEALTAEQTTNEQLLVSLEQLAEEIQSRRPDPALEQAIERVTDAIARRQRLLGRVERLANNPSAGFSTPMTALARQVPEGLWLTSLNLQPGQIVLTGRTNAGRLVPQYLERLGEEPVFAGHAFGDFSLTRSDDHPWIEFRVATSRDREGDQ